MTYDEILYNVADGIATITLNRPDKLNAWTMKMGHEVEHAFMSASDDTNARVIVITGAGRSFCAGADLSLLGSVSGTSGPASPAEADWATPFNLYLMNVKKPIIAAINGPAVGMGLMFALFCDIRFGSSATRISTAFSRLGLVAEWGAAWILPRIVGLPKAFDLLYSSRTIDAQESLQIGLLNAVYPVETFAEEVHTYATHLAANISARSMSIMRMQLYAGLSQTNDEAAGMANHEMYASLVRPDFKEGLMAFLEKRTPRFTD